MDRKSFIGIIHTKTRYYSTPTGAKIAHVQPKDGDTSCWWYIWDIDGDYKGCVNEMKGQSVLKEITKEDFLK